jgi:hypothetical protein
MSNSNQELDLLLDEYCDIYYKLKVINDRIQNLKQDTKNKVEKVNKETEKLDILTDYQLKIKKIKGDKVLKEKYISMTNRLKEIRKMLVINHTQMTDNKIKDNNTNLEDKLTFMLNKYKNKYNKESEQKESVKDKDLIKLRNALKLNQI